MLTKRQKQMRWMIGKLAAAVFIAALVLLPKDIPLQDLGNFNPLVSTAMAAGG